MNADCPFCKPHAHEIVEESEHVIVLVDVRPICVGHVLVIPRRHVPAAKDLDPVVSAELDQAVNRLLDRHARIWGSATAYEHGGTVLCRPHLGRTDPAHAHIHVLPSDVDAIEALPAQFVGKPGTQSGYLWQRLGSRGPADQIPIVGGTPRHLVRTLVQPEFADSGIQWNPLSAPDALHRATFEATHAVLALAGASPSEDLADPCQLVESVVAARAATVERLEREQLLVTFGRARRRNSALEAVASSEARSRRIVVRAPAGHLATWDVVDGVRPHARLAMGST